MRPEAGMRECAGTGGERSARPMGPGRRRACFFFKQKTAYEFLTCDWSSDVCSSDLLKSNAFKLYQ